uniref:class I SAM-dependent methyltransferase n=1 Tax=uncultured Draconibacterium sp. TaxID=1573823 RepID=UPI0032171EDF
MSKCNIHLGCNCNNRVIYSQDGDLKFKRCNDCGIIWRSSDSMIMTKPYDQSYFDSKKYEKRREHKVKKSGWLLDIALKLNPNISKVLEVGCSIGYTLEAAKRRNLDHLGIDISEYAVEFCKNRGLKAELYSFDDLKEQGELYDLLYMQHVLEHFEDPFETLKKCNELLNPNGTIVILVPNSSYRPAHKKRENHRFYSKNGVGTEHYAYFNYINLPKVLEASGFEVIQKNYPLFLNGLFPVEFFLNRIFRRLLTVFNQDQELVIIAKKR